VSTLQALRLRDRTTRQGGLSSSIDLSPLAGSWINTETRRPWLSSIEVRVDADRLRIHPRGGDAPSPADWGEREADLVCATAIDSTEAGGYVATFPLESMETEIQATLNQGLLVVVAFNRGRDAASAPGRVTREFFRRVGESV
jgi:hypothetical protein